MKNRRPHTIPSAIHVKRASCPAASSFPLFSSVKSPSDFQKIRANSRNTRKKFGPSQLPAFSSLFGEGVAPPRPAPRAPAQRRRMDFGHWPLNCLHSALMTKPPLIFISPSIEVEGFEFSDRSISLSEAYQRAIAAAGGLPLTLPMGDSRQLIAECVDRADGILITGGDDIEPRLYQDRVPPKLRKTVETTPDGGERDLRELILIDEVFRQHKPLLAICRGQQLLNIALGGTLVVYIPAEVPGALKHARMDKSNDIVHEVQLTRDSLLSKITGKRTLGVNSTRITRPWVASPNCCR